MLLESAAFGALFAAIIGGSVAFNRKQTQVTNDVIWRPATKTLAGTCTLPGPFESVVGGGTRTLSATVDGTSVSVRAVAGKHARMTAIATFEPRLDVVIALVPEAALTPLGKAIGVVKDQEVGDVAFDARFVVSSNDAAFCRAWLTDTLRAAFLAKDLRNWEASIQQGVVQMESGEAPGCADEVVLAAQLTAGLAGRARQLADEWETLAVALAGTLGSGVAFQPIRIQRGAFSLEVTVVREKGSSTTRVQLSVADGAEPIGIDLGRLTFSPEVIEAAVTALVERAGGDTSPYRGA